MKRVSLFVVTNLAILFVVSVIFSVTGLEEYFRQQGVGLQLEPLLVFCLIFGMGGSFLSLSMSKWMAKRAVGAHVIETPTNQAEQWLVERVGIHAKAAGIGMPEVAIFDSPSPNAFATGARRDSSLVAVSTGLMRSMKPNEVDAVLGHEIGHVANGDMVTLALVQGVLNTFVFFFSRVIGHVVDRAVFRGDERSVGYGPGYWITTIFAQIVLGILASIIVMWFSRQREFRADEAGARLAGRENMAAALRRLKSHVEGAEELPEQLQAFGISGGRSRFTELFSSHPPLEARIAALEAYTG